MSLDLSIEYPVRIRADEEELLYPWTFFDLPDRSLPFPPLQDTIRDWVSLTDNSTSGGPLNLVFGRNVCETGEGVRNCTGSCSDPAYLFRPMNFRPCLVLAGAALLVQQESYSLDMEDEGTAKTIESWQGLDLSTFNATGTLTNIAACVSEACNESGRQDCAGLAETLEAISSNPANGTSSEIARSLTTDINEYCSATHIQMDGDIAGPGVVLSYTFQTSLALLFYFFLKLSRTWTRRIIYLLSYCGLPNLRNRGVSLQKKIEESIFGAAAVSSIAEFHEIQCYFIASIQIATLICFDSNNPKAAGNKSTSFGQAIFNAETSIILSITSIAPVLLTQFSLQRAGIHWWYTFITMTFTVILAVIIYARQAVVMVSPDGLWDNLVSERAVTSCGMNPAPIVYCGLFDDPGFTTMGAIPVYTGCLVGLIAWFGLLIDQIAYTICTKFPSAVQKPGILRWVARLLDTSKQNILGRGLVVLFHSLANVLLIFNIGMYSVLLGFTIRGTDFNNISGWSFGQLVAVMVWTPTMIKYLYYIAFGIERGFEERIPEAYTISRQTTRSAESQSDPKHDHTPELFADSPGSGEIRPAISRRSWRDIR